MERWRGGKQRSRERWKFSPLRVLAGGAVLLVLVQALFWHLVPQESSNSSLSSRLHIPSTRKQTSSDKNMSRQSQEFPGFNSSKSLNLPALSFDNSELFISALIERSSRSQLLHLTTFLLNTGVVMPNLDRRKKISKIHVDFEPQWTEVVGKMSRVNYFKSGRRKNETFFCRIYNSLKSKPYVVEGEFVPNTRSMDVHMNRRLDILRCPLRSKDINEELLNSFFLTNESVGVEIIRRSKVIGQFDIDWNHRRGGYLLSPLKLLSVEGKPHTSLRLSGLNAWEGHRRFLTSGDHENSLTATKCHICVMGLQNIIFDKTFLPRLIDFIEYHILLGAHHMYFAFDFSTESPVFLTLTKVLSDYINSGHISLASTAENRVYKSPSSILGLQFHLSTIDAMRVNSCLYLAKGIAEYVGVWRANDFIVPLPPSHSISSMILAASRLSKKVIANGEMKDNFCYFYISALQKYPQSESFSPPSSLTNRYSFHNDVVRDKNDRRLIMNSENIYQGGENIPGVCVNSSSYDHNFTGMNDNSDTKLSYDDGTYIKMHNYGYLYTLFEKEKHSESENGKVLKFSDDIAKTFFTRSQGRAVEKLSKIGDEELSTCFVVRPRRPFKQWRSYTSLYRPAYDIIDERLDIVDGLNKSQLILRHSKNGYLNISDPLKLSLPAFAPDFSDIALGAIIERNHQSWSLYVTTFFLHHKIFEADEGYGINRIKPDLRSMWSSAAELFASTQYTSSGVRQDKYQRYYRCRIKNSEGEAEYIVKGEFIPTKLSPDSNANNKIDIFRCKIKRSKHAYQNFAGTSQHAEITIMNANDVPVFHYTLPWESRRIGYMLSIPQVADSFQPWKGFRKNSSKLPGAKHNDKIYLCAPGFESPVSQKSLSFYFEFLQHHFVVGVQHVLASGSYSWESTMMSQFLSAMQSFTSDGLLTFASQSGDNINLLNSVLGASLDRDVIKVIYVNMCLYLCKGMVDYMAVWDVDEYFIPKLPHHTLVDVINEIKKDISAVPIDSEGLNAATSKSHHVLANSNKANSFCYMLLSSEVIFSSLNVDEKNDMLKPWVGVKFANVPEDRRGASYSFKKSIIPTDRIYYAGLHMHGACDVDGKWVLAMEENADSSYGAIHKLEVSIGAVTRVSERLASIYHFQIHRLYEKATMNSLMPGNEYSNRFFPQVMTELTRRGMASFITVPDNSPIIATADTEWIPFENVPLLEESVTSSNMSKDSVAFGTLPAFASDFSEVFIGSVIERAPSSLELYVTTFLFCHEEISSATDASIEPSSIQPWSALRSFSTYRRYTNTGARANKMNFNCRLSNFYGGQTYKVKGHFIPNRLSVDSNANSKVDILRCPMRKSKYSIADLSSSIFEVAVQIFFGNVPLVKFRLPWKTRRVGYMLTSPPAMARLNAWKGLITSKTKSDKSRHDLHMSVPGFESPISKRSLAEYAEFLQHHINIGVQHVHIAASYRWGDNSMQQFTDSLASFIEEGAISVASSAADSDRVAGWLGLSIDRDIVKVIFVNMCLYWTRGMVDYLAIWDIDEFFIPKIPHHSIMDVISQAESPLPLQPLPQNSNAFELVDSWKGGRGWADGDGHPFCYIRLLSESLFRSEELETSLSIPWIGSRYSLGSEKDQSFNFEKAILPTAKIFQAGLHTGAGCKLDYPFSGCNSSGDGGFCLVDRQAQRFGYTIVREPYYNSTDFSFEQRFDGYIFNKDAKTIKPHSDGLLYHIQIHRNQLTSTSNDNTTNEYVTRFYPKIRLELRKRAFETKVLIPGVLRSVMSDIDKVLGWREL